MAFEKAVENSYHVSVSKSCPGAADRLFPRIAMSIPSQFIMGKIDLSADNRTWAFAFFNSACRILTALAVAAVLFVSPRPSGAGQEGIDYEILFQGLENAGIESDLRALSDMVELKDKPPAGFGLLRSRAERDRKGFVEYLNARGWYAAEINLRFDREVSPVRVIFDVKPGPPYLLEDMVIRAVEGMAELELPSAEDLGMFEGKRFEAREFLSGEERLLSNLKRRGHPFPSLIDRRVTVNHRDRTVSAHITVDPGPAARLGEPHFEGLESVEEIFVRQMVPWQPGDAYSPVLLQSLHRRLSASGLFAAIRVREGERLDEDGVLPVTVSFTERKHRSVGAGLSYNSDEGPGGKLSWEHRNILRHGERLALGASASDFTRDATIGFQKPHFLRTDQWLRLNTRFADDKPDAYESRSFASSLLVDRELGRGIVAGAGLGYKESRIIQFVGEDRERYRIVSLPLALSQDTSDDLLDPKRGGRLTIETTPMLNVTRSTNAFLKLYSRYRRYLTVSDQPSITLAGSVAAGMIAGAGQRDVPADERFYAGGGGSIRGYSYQSVGPIVGTVPAGGRSLLECSFEIRTSLTEKVGIVGFMDGGTAYESKSFGSGETFRWGTGLGLRYKTPVGPLRLDVGVPLNRRSGTDDSFQFYLSLGQAF